MYAQAELGGQAWLAQSVERWTFNPTAAGSSPASGSLFIHFQNPINPYIIPS